MSLTFHDMFCGAGGSTLGALMAGATPSVGMNHWRVACESYETNHAPHGARAACVDVVTQDPRRYPKADLLLASPECTHHSYARGKAKDDPSLFDPDGDQGAERSRATMWDVVRFAEVHEYRLVIVENVEAAVKWGLPKKAKLKHGHYGPLFLAWLQAMEALEYRWQLVHLNSMVCGVPQSRDRLYVVFWRKGQRAPDLEITALAWCPSCEGIVDAVQRWRRPGATTGSHGQQYDYACPRCDVVCAVAIRPAATAIDWSLPSVKIGERVEHGLKPLKPGTFERIRRGLPKLATRPPLAFLPDHGLVVQVGANLYERERKDGTTYARAHTTDETMKAVTRTADRALVVPTTHADGSDRTRGVDGELPALTGRQELGLMYAGRESGVPRPADSEPMQTLTRINSLYVVGAGALVLANKTHNVPRRASDEAMHALQTGQHEAVVIAERGTPTRPGGTNQSRRPDDEPIDTVSAQGNHHALVVANYGSPGAPASKSGWARHVDDDPVGTVTATDSHALFCYRDGVGVRGLEEPAPTVATVDQQALVGDITNEQIEACTFRMVQPHELKVASGFTADYTLHGTKRDQVCQVGNAVTAPAEAELVRRAIASLDA